MAYTQRMALGAFPRKSNAFDTAENLAATAAVHGGYLITKPCSISEFQFYVTTTLVAGVTAPQVKITKRPTYNSASSEVVIATMTIPNGTAAGKVVGKRFSPVQLDVGDELNFEHITVANDTGTAAGAGFYNVTLDVDDENDTVETDYITSA